MGAYGFEYDLAISAGVDSLFNATPIDIVGNGKVEGVKFLKTEVVDGQLTSIKGSDFIIPCDMVIKATGQAKQGAFYQLLSDLEVNSRTRIVVNSETFQTSKPQYFAGGDAVNGGAEVVNAAYDGKMAAKGIDHWLKEIES
jgi:glutamate synthase (NADPH/NADH) small chain